MFKINFYSDRHGKSPIKEYLKELDSKKDKFSWVKSQKINDFIQILSEKGLQIGEPYIKYIDSGIWELRPKDDRIFFVSFENNSFLLLHYFTKKTNKTPRKEIEQAKKNLADIKERGNLWIVLN